MVVTPAPRSGENAPLSAEKFLSLLDGGKFSDGHVELLHGETILKISQGPLYVHALMLVQRALQAYTGQGRVLLAQSSVYLSPDSVAEPDVAIVTEAPVREEREVRGSDVHLVVEISDSSLRKDREVKSALYATAGIPEYWIVNPVARQVEIRLKPSGSYSETAVLGDGDISPWFSQAKVSVASFFSLPQRRLSFESKRRISR